MISSRTTRTIPLAALALIAGCRRELSGFPAPDNELYFPLPVQLHTVPARTDAAGNAVPEKHVAYVGSTNWDQRYNSGWISVVDLDLMISKNRNFKNYGSSEVGTDGALLPAAVINHDRNASPPDGNHILVPSLGGGMKVSPDGRLMVATFRNRAQIMVFEIRDDGSLYCGDPQSQAGLNADDRLTDCDGAHIYNFTQRGPDFGLIQDQFVDPFSVQFLDGPTSDSYTLVIGFLQAFQGIRQTTNNRTPENTGALISFLDLNAARDPDTGLLAAGELLGNQRSINLSLLTGTQVLASTTVAIYPVTTFGRYVTIAARGLATTSLTTTTLFNIDIDNFDFYADNTEDLNDDVNNIANLNVFDVRSDSGGFNVSDLVYKSDGTRAFITLSYSQQAAGVADSVVMLDSSLRTETIIRNNDERVQVTRPIFRLLDTIPVLGTPQSLQYIERAGVAPLVVTATLVDNSVHFIRVNPTSLDALTRVDYQVGQAPTTVRYTRFAVPGDAAPHDYVFIPSFLDHGFNFFDITNTDPAKWGQGYIRSDLDEGNRYR
ncbi:MAG: hypothetical protein H7Z43_13755 [Clostridia bacterium]|nr:hypothetical protein [Deltaproteobacteria bacterium]